MRREHARGEVGDRDEVDLEHRVDRVHLLLLEQPAGHLAGVVDEQVDVAQVERVDAGVDRLAAGEVHADRADALDRLEGVGVAHAGEHEPHRPGGERLAHGAADAAVGAGDEGGAAGQVHAVATRPAARAISDRCAPATRTDP